MISLIIIVLIFVGILWFNGFGGKKYVEQYCSLNENGIVKKFNKLLNNIKKDNFSIIKEKLLETLEEYKAVKKAQFVENRTYLTEALSAVTEQEVVMARAVNQKEVTIRMNRSKYSPEEGAHQMYELEIHRDTLTRLTNAKADLSNKISVLDSRIVQFEGSLALRKAQIVSMIAESISINNHSFIDLRLDSLEQEFKHEVNKSENQKEVDKLMGDANPVKIDFDLEKYKKAFEDFK